MIEKSAIFADIGCDHGLISLRVLKEQLADFVYATDISEKSLQKAKQTLKGYKNCECVVGDGFESIKQLPDTAVISGMGGHEIIKIISGYRIQKLILQPQNAVNIVRAELCANGYKIVEDVVTQERNKFYDVIKAEYAIDSMPTQLDSLMQEFGVFYKIKNLNLKRKLEKLERALSTYKMTEENKEKLKNLQEVKRWQM